MESSDINIDCKYGNSVRMRVSGNNGKSVEIFLTSQGAIEIGEALIKGGKLSEERPVWPKERIPDSHVQWT